MFEVVYDVDLEILNGYLFEDDGVWMGGSEGSIELDYLSEEFGVD